MALKFQLLQNMLEDYQFLRALSCSPSCSHAFRIKKKPAKIAEVWIMALELLERVGWSMLVFHLTLRVKVEGYILGGVSKLVESLPVLHIF